MPNPTKEQRKEWRREIENYLPHPDRPVPTWTLESHTLLALLDAADRVGVLEALLREVSPDLHQRLNQHRCRTTCRGCRIDTALEPEAVK